MIKKSEALVLLMDLQDELIPLSRTQDPAQIRRAGGVVCRVADALGIPAVASVVPLGPTAPGPIDEVTAALPGLTTVARSGAQAWLHRTTVQAIERHAPRVVALAGVASEVAVLHAALGARERGLEVHLLVDVCGGLSERTERAAFQRMQDAGILMSSAISFVSSLTEDFESTDGQVVFGSIMELAAG